MRGACWCVAMAIAVTACHRDPGPWRLDRVEDNGQLAVARAQQSSFATLDGVAWPPRELPTAHTAALELQRLTATGAIAIAWTTADPDGYGSGPASLRIDGADVAEQLIGLGLGARPELAAAEARARAAHVGGWSDAGKAEILRWLRGRALTLQVLGEDVDAMAWRATAWQVAAQNEAPRLAFFEINAGTDPGPPPCVDRLVTAILPRLRPATTADVARAFTGPVLVQVPATGAARCVTWTVQPGVGLERHDATSTAKLGVRLVPDQPTVEWTSKATAEQHGEVAGVSGSSGVGTARVTAASDDALVIGGTPWFTTEAACQRALAAAFPSGCAEP
ncbi:MAG: hypothetical protein K8W52_08100 [Deltaproteobacteria bacterium]|nr:hypothetical protein [Deltaproteobacteria bacterium]